MASSEWLVSAEAGPPWLCGFVCPASPPGFDTMILMGAMPGVSNIAWLKSLCFFVVEGMSVVGIFCSYCCDIGSLQKAVDRMLDAAFIIRLLLLPLVAELRLDTTL